MKGTKDSAKAALEAKEENSNVSPGLEYENDERVFARVMKIRNDVFSIEVPYPQLDEPIVIYYANVKKSEQRTDTDIKAPEDFDEMDFGAKMAFFEEIKAASVWEMIEKAQSIKGAVPKKHIIHKAEWVAIGEDLPGLRSTITGRVTGSTEEMVKSFLLGPTKPSTE